MGRAIYDRCGITSDSEKGLDSINAAKHGQRITKKGSAMTIYIVKRKNLNPDTAGQIRPLIKTCGGKDRTRKKGIVKTVVGVFPTKEQARDFREQTEMVPKVME